MSSIPQTATGNDSQALEGEILEETAKELSIAILEDALRCGKPMVE